VPFVEGLRAGEAAWQRLREHSPGASPFASWGWHDAWANVASPEELRTSCTVVIRGASGTIDALLPLAIRRIRFCRRLVTALTWASGDLGCPDHLDVLALPDTDWSAAAAALTSLSWDVMVLGNLAPNATNALRLADALARNGYRSRCDSLWACPSVELPDSWDAYLATLSANWRQIVRRKERNLRRNHAVMVTNYDNEHFEQGWSRLVALHEQRWTGAGGGAFRDSRAERLHRNFARHLAAERRLWLTTLDVDGQPAAAWYGFTDGDTIYFCQGGRDLGRDNLSVGLVLMALMIRRAIEHGYRRFDFLRGDEAYKLHWNAKPRVTAELAAFRPSLRGRWLRGLDLAARLRPHLRAHATIL
jgi:CelD/BcsL family acetyltransferase involved in cellulose biosynthesis